ncbi:hypothetical protein [Alishewanella longhuensis]
MTDMQHNGENIASPYKKSKTANLFSIAIEIVATAVKKFFRHTLLRRPKPDRDNALYRTTVQKLQQHYTDRLTELETQRQKVAGNINQRCPVIVLNYTYSTSHRQRFNYVRTAINALV